MHDIDIDIYGYVNESWASLRIHNKKENARITKI